MEVTMRHKKQCSVAVMFIIFGMVIFCFHNPVHAKQNIKLKVKNIVLSSYFAEMGVTYQHAASSLFCRDKKIMNWLFSQTLSMISITVPIQQIMHGMRIVNRNEMETE